jgi:hypothetical protein
LDEWGIRVLFPGGVTVFLFSTAFKMGFWAYLPSCPMGTLEFLPKVKIVGHSPPSCLRVKKAQSYISTP